MTDSEIDQSVIMEGARIRAVPRLTDSLMGRDSEVTTAAHDVHRRPV
nr:hypothetical protein [Candidatus Microthrix sp.]